jgi:hypothetical protein
MIYTLELYGKRQEAPNEITLRVFKDKIDRDFYAQEFTKDDGINYRRFVDLQDNETIKV